eukprot:scaffold118739_cov26-Cyclotella_meneghiniana.AAC.2
MRGGFDSQMAVRFKCGGYRCVPGGKMKNGRPSNYLIDGRRALGHQLLNDGSPRHSIAGRLI